MQHAGEVAEGVSAGGVLYGDGMERHHCLVVATLTTALIGGAGLRIVGDP